MNDAVVSAEDIERILYDLQQIHYKRRCSPLANSVFFLFIPFLP